MRFAILFFLISFFLVGCSTVSDEELRDAINNLEPIGEDYSNWLPATELSEEDKELIDLLIQAGIKHSG